MNEADGLEEEAAWTDAVSAAALFCVDPVGLGGVSLRALAGPARERWLALVRSFSTKAAPMRRIPLHVTDSRLLGGVDLAATLRSGRPVAERGLLAEADGGIVLLAMAERVAPTTIARIVAALDSGETILERDGLSLRSPSRFGVVALDEGMTEDEQPSSALLDRLAFHVSLEGVGSLSGAFSASSEGLLLPPHPEALEGCGEKAKPVLSPVEGMRGAGPDAPESQHEPHDIFAARALLRSVMADDDMIAALCETAAALGVSSLRAPILALRTARAAAALDGRTFISKDDAALAARLVLAPRAKVFPSAQEPSEADDGESDQPEPPPRDDAGGEGDEDSAAPPLSDLILAAAQAAIPAGLLARLMAEKGDRQRARSSGRSGEAKRSTVRGRPAGVRRGEPRSGARLNVVETLRAAAPWQALRRREDDRDGPFIEIRRDDFRISHFKRRTQTTTIFVVDASGSAAFNRLAEAKGAVETLLAECYVRRDRAALIAFRGRGAELLLPPTRSLARAKRSLASLPGGGGTPLATGIEAAAALADAVKRKGETPLIVLLTDGGANVDRTGAAGRIKAGEDALSAGRVVRAAGISCLLIDVSPHPKPFAGRLAAEMGASHLPLPYADAAFLSEAARAAGRRSR